MKKTTISMPTGIPGLDVIIRRGQAAEVLEYFQSLREYKLDRLFLKKPGLEASYSNKCINPVSKIKGPAVAQEIKDIFEKHTEAAIEAAIRYLEDEVYGGA